MSNYIMLKINDAVLCSRLFQVVNVNLKTIQLSVSLQAQSGEYTVLADGFPKMN